MEQIERIRERGGWLNRYTHVSECCRCSMTFSVYLPPQADSGSVPMLYWLSGLTCTDDNFRVKAGTQRDFPLTLRRQDGYDHSYHFIATFIGEHIAWHARRCLAANGDKSGLNPPSLSTVRPISH